MRKIRVVAGVIIENDVMLIAQRSASMSAPLKWEIPGGKVEEGESDRGALRRELQEELGIDVQVEGFLCTSRVVSHAYEIEMFVYRCQLIQGNPQALEHAQLYWAKAAEIDSFDWAEADIPLVDYFVDALNGNS